MATFNGSKPFNPKLKEDHKVAIDIVIEVIKSITFEKKMKLEIPSNQKEMYCAYDFIAIINEEEHKFEVERKMGWKTSGKFQPSFNGKVDWPARKKYSQSDWACMTNCTLDTIYVIKTSFLQKAEIFQKNTRNKEYKEYTVGESFISTNVTDGKIYSKINGKWNLISKDPRE